MTTWAGMHGGEIIIKPLESASYAPEQNVIVGNTCSTARRRQSLLTGWLVSVLCCPQPKGTAVIEGAGDHCCEYMTGGGLSYWVRVAMSEPG